MKIRAVGAGLLLVAAGAAPAIASDTARPLCHLNDDGSWTYSADHYDDAREGGHVMDRMANSDGTCTWPQVNLGAPAVVPTKPAVQLEVRTVVKTVVRVKVIKKRVVVRNGKRTVTRTVSWR